MFCWGKCAEGQLGLGEVEGELISTPRVVDELDLSCEVKRAVCGWRHTAFLCNDGTIHTCGNNEYGQLGHGKGTKKAEHVHALETFTIIQVACGQSHMLAISDQGLVFSWGEDTYGQLGLGEMVPRVQPSPKMVKFLSKWKVVQVACGANHSMALTIGGHLFSWGQNSRGQLGIGSSHNQIKPEPVTSLSGIPFSLICAGGYHSFALSSSGALFGWGKNNFGQLGVHDDKDRLMPTLLKSLRSQYVCHVACGENHTAVLTNDGGVFTFGCGNSGQLGHNSDNDEYSPRKVFELMGSVVTQIACGRSHTLAFVPSTNKIYAFGCGDSGQLGCGVTSSSNSPVPVKGPWVSSRDSSAKRPECIVKRISAGGEHCFTLTHTFEDEMDGPDDLRTTTHPQQLLTLSEPVTREMLDSVMLKPESYVSEKLETIFSSLACLNGSFLDKSHERISSHVHGIKLSAARRSFNMLGGVIHEQIRHTIYSAVANFLIPSMLVQAPPDIEALRIYIILPECEVLHRSEYYETVVIPFGECILKLSPEAQRILRRWWSTLPSTYFSRAMKVFQECVKFLLMLPLPQVVDKEALKRQFALYTCMRVLDQLYRVNEESGSIVPFKQFYIPEIQENVNIQADYYNWIQDERTFSFCRFPFVFDANAKSKLLQTDAILQMQSAVDEVNRLNVQSMMFSMNLVNPCLVIMVRRASIVQDTLTQITKQSPYDLKKPLKVIFANEEAVDAGGVRKEFFLLLLTEILDPKYGMFTYLEESQTIWFNDLTFEESPMFLLIGVICGLAIYNSTIIDLRFPPVLYKKLLGRQPVLDDYRGFQPSVARNLQYLLDYSDGDLEDIFGLNFQIVREKYGTIENIDLVPRGGEILVSADNRQHYVDMYIDYYLNKAVEKQFEAFATGFHRVCGGRVLEFFHPEELMEMVVGCQEYDFKVLEKVAEYKGEFYHNHPVIRNFWEVFHEFPVQMKKKFLAFLTGSDRVPILGMKSMKIIIQPVAGGDNGDHLPVAHTCFNLLDLPRYPTTEMMRTKLSQAVENSTGFGLA